MFIVALAFTSCDVNDIPGISDIIGAARSKMKMMNIMLLTIFTLSMLRETFWNMMTMKLWLAGIKGEDGEDGVTP